MTSSTSATQGGLGFRAFVALIASLMAVNALGIDTMLPALPQIGESLHFTHDNQRQWIIAAYLLGFGSAQLIYGPLADRFGRKPILLSMLLVYVATSFAAAAAIDLTTILAARVMQGIAAAATRVLAITVVRDRYSGPQMARVMSLSSIIFITVPILAPSLGQLILLVAPWRWIFIVLALYASAIMLWVALRLPETLNPLDRRPITPVDLLAASKLILTHRQSIGYTLAGSMLYGAFYGFLASSQQICADVFGRPELFGIIFASIAASLGAASILNARIVGPMGIRRVSHTALIGFVCFSTIHAAIAISGRETLLSFTILQAASVACFGLAASNFSALAMEPVGHLAGTASSIQGFISTVSGALLGIFIGQSLDGSTVPLTVGFCLLGTASVMIVLIAEGRLFRPPDPIPSDPQIELHSPEA